MYHGYNPPSIVLASRRLLPTGDCGFVIYADPLPPSVFHTTQSVRCQCRNFWPNPHTADLCACGHHACYHSQEPTPPPTPSSPSTVLTIGAYASLMNRISHLEQELDAQNATRRKEMTVYQPELTGVMNELRGLENKMIELVERGEETEERLSEMERLEMVVEGRLDDLEAKTEELEEEIDTLKDGFDEEDEDDKVHRAKQEENHRPEPKGLENGVVDILLDEPKEQSKSKSKCIKTELDDKKDSKTSGTTTFATVILTQPQFLRTFSLKRRLSDSSLLESNRSNSAKKFRDLSDSF